jgi:hypothetical protein
MICKPDFSYFLANEKYPIRPAGSQWTSVLPVSRTPLAPEPAGQSLTYGDYFNAVRIFLERHQYSAVIRALSCGDNGNMDAAQIQDIRIFLVKHGQYYHPARIEIAYGKRTHSFVLNVAISAIARELITSEGAVLEFLCSRFPYAFLPKVYATGEVCIHDGRKLGMFLGQWFDGYHEFHLSRGDEGGQDRIILWDGKPTKRFLSSGQARAVYEKAALILTAYYNLATFEQISAWHHAAGDFVIKPVGDQILMKLITVRQYTPLLENEEPDVQAILEALQLFLLKLSLQMGLDRLDGVGDLTWAGEMAVAGAVDGFFKGLMCQVNAGLIPGEIVEGCREYLAAVSRSEWTEKVVSVMDPYDSGLPGLSLIQPNLNQYITCLYKSVADVAPYTI